MTPYMKGRSDIPWWWACIGNQYTSTNVQFLLSDNGISPDIFHFISLLANYFLCIICRLVCPKMCCKNFENWLTIEKVLPKNNFE